MIVSCISNIKKGMNMGFNDFFAKKLKIIGESKEDVRKKYNNHDNSSLLRLSQHGPMLNRLVALEILKKRGYSK